LDEFAFDLQGQIATGRRMPHKEVAALDDILVSELSSALELAEKRERFGLGELGVSRDISPVAPRDMGWEHTCVSRFLLLLVILLITAALPLHRHLPIVEFTTGQHPYPSGRSAALSTPK
jgi:hypothetical protein